MGERGVHILARLCTPPHLFIRLGRKYNRVRGLYWFWSDCARTPTPFYTSGQNVEKGGVAVHILARLCTPPTTFYTFEQKVKTGGGGGDCVHSGQIVHTPTPPHPLFLYSWAGSIKGREACAHPIQIVHIPHTLFILRGRQYKRV